MEKGWQSIEYKFDSEPAYCDVDKYIYKDKNKRMRIE